MAQYSIKELESLSGIKAHTIRIWEKRYRIVSPNRSATNIRSYSDDDLKKIMTVSLLNSHGIKISKIASLSSTEMASRVSDLSNRSTSTEVHIDRLVVAMVDLDEEVFENIINELISKHGLEYTIIEVAYPFLEKIGVLWLTGNISPVQEHFISNLLRQKILVAIDGLSIPKKTSDPVLMFLPEEELHEIGLLFCHYIVRKAGYRTYYMGQQVPYPDIQWFCKHYRPVAMITSITTSPNPQFVERYLSRLCADHRHVTILASGRLLQKIALKFPPNLQIFESTAQLKSLLKQLKRP